MRLAVIADIHGNVLALDAVLADLSRHAPDLVVNLGDCVSGPLWPRETMERLNALGAPTVRGNHDREVSAAVASADLGPSDRYAHGQLTAEQRAQLGSLPMQVKPAPGVLAFHARPDDDVKYLTEDVESGRLVRAPPRKIAKRLSPVDARLVLCGHSHRPDAVQLPGGPLIVNPGSVGCPAYDANGHVSESGSPYARYAIIDVSSDGPASVSFQLAPYPFEDAARQAERNRRSEWAHALRTGFMPPRD
ncbi:MAG: metallophosphoesterase family protein [Propylenella sp.]